MDNNYQNDTLALSTGDYEIIRVCDVQLGVEKLNMIFIKINGTIKQWYGDDDQRRKL